jgi:HSP90 family molecular chaperone
LRQHTERRLKDLVKKHGEFSSYPISIYVEKTTEKEVEDEKSPPGRAPPFFRRWLPPGWPRASLMQSTSADWN